MSKLKSQVDHVCRDDEPPVASKEDDITRSPPKSRVDPKTNPEWSISFEQFFASVLTEAPLCEYFERKFSLTEKIAKLRTNRRHKHFSSQISRDESERVTV